MRRAIFLFMLLLVFLFATGATYINGVERIQSIMVSTILGPLTIGNAGATSHSLTADDDLMVSGKLEVDGLSYFDGTANFYSNAAYSGYIYLGTGMNSAIKYDTAQTADGVMWGLPTASRSVVIFEQGDTKDFTHAQQVNPTVYIHSSDATDLTQWISFTHDQTNGVIDVGKGKLTTADAFQAADFYSGDGTQGATDSTSFWLCTAADCATKCQVTIKDGLITSCT